MSYQAKGSSVFWGRGAPLLLPKGVLLPMMDFVIGPGTSPCVCNKFKDLCRCIAMATGNSFAAKRLSRGQDYYLVENEFFGLSQAKRRFIPRVVRLEDLTNCRTGDPILILE